MIKISKSKIKMEVPYFQTPNAIYEMTDLDIYELSVYIYLCRCGNQGAKAFPSYKTIADKCKMSRVKAIDTVDKLIQKEYIKKKARSKSGESQSNIYIVDNLVNRVNHLVNNMNPYKEPIIKNQLNNIPQKGLHKIGNKHYYYGKKITKAEYQHRVTADLNNVMNR